MIWRKGTLAIDEWAQIGFDGVREGAEMDLAGGVDAQVTIEMGYDDASAHANGPRFAIEVSGSSSGDEDWAELVAWRGIAATAATEAVFVDADAGATVITVQSTTGFETTNALYFIKNTTLANCEIIREVSYTDNDSITILDGLTNAQLTTAAVLWNVAEKYIVSIPDGYQRARVLVWNDDADATVCTKTVLTKRIVAQYKKVQALDTVHYGT